MTTEAAGQSLSKLRDSFVIISLITPSGPVLHSQFRKSKFICKETETNRLNKDLVSGLCAVYSSGGCTFLRQDHMTGAMGCGRVGTTIVGLN